MATNIKKVDFTKKRKWLRLLFAALAIYLVAIFVSQQSTINAQRQQIDSIGQDIEAMEKLNAGMKQEIDLLHNDPGYIEGIVRRELGLVRESEILYILPRWKDE